MRHSSIGCQAVARAQCSDAASCLRYDTMRPRYETPSLRREMARCCWHIPDFAPAWHASPGAIAEESGCTLAAESSEKPPRWAPSPLATNSAAATLNAGYLANARSRHLTFVASGRTRRHAQIIQAPEQQADRNCVYTWAADGTRMRHRHNARIAAQGALTTALRNIGNAVG